jgi:hypothetical protein
MRRVVSLWKSTVVIAKHVEATYRPVQTITSNARLAFEAAAAAGFRSVLSQSPRPGQQAIHCMFQWRNDRARLVEGISWIVQSAIHSALTASVDKDLQNITIERDRESGLRPVLIIIKIPVQSVDPPWVALVRYTNDRQSQRTLGPGHGIEIQDALARVAATV